MKHPFRRLVIAALLGSSAPLAAQNLVQNGSFEDGPTVPLSTGWLLIGTGSTDIVNWFVIQGPITYINEWYHPLNFPPDGLHAVHLNGPQGPGTIFTDLPTVPGQEYLLSFEMAGDHLGPPNLKTMHLEIRSSIGPLLAAGDYQVDVTGQTDPTWTTRYLPFIGGSPLTNIEFSSTTFASQNGPMVDDVQVVEALSQTYCVNPPNSTGYDGVVTVVGSAVVSDNDVQLFAHNLPPGENGFFLVSRTHGSFMPANSIGTICLGGDIGRFALPHQVGQGPEISIDVDLNNIPTNTPGSQQVQPGETLNFQLWHRDGNSSNLTRAVEVQFQ